MYVWRSSVASRAYPVEKSKITKLPLTVNKRILLFILAYAIQLIYIPTSNRVSGGIEPRLSIDIFPIWSIWVLPYVLCYALWLFSVIWIILKTEDRLFRSFLAACIFTFTFGVIIFILVPTYVKPASLDGNDIFTLLLRIIHEHWGRYDAFPSGHVYITTLLAFFFSRWYPRWKYLWIMTLVVVSFSTLFTGQHYILDVIGGFGLALAGYHFGLWWGGFYPVQKQSNKRSGKRIASSSLN